MGWEVSIKQYAFNKMMAILHFKNIVTLELAMNKEK